MGNRSKPYRSKTQLLVAASAITRACSSAKPSRITVLRLLGDALHAFEESQLVVNEIKARTLAYTARDRTSAATRGQLDADTRVRSSHEQGARALFSAVASALIKLPTRAGPLRRRAVDLLTATGRAAGPAVVMQAASNVRSHISSLKRLTWSDSDHGDFEVVCAIMTLADVSNSAIAGRDVAKDSVVFLLGTRVRQKCKRTDLAFAIAQIVQSFPMHAPPDDRLVDNLLSFALQPPTSKQGCTGVGCALLAAVAAPHLVSRGAKPADDVVSACGRSLRTASTSTERAMWAVAMARASVTARRSPKYQLLKYGNFEAGTKFPNSQKANGQQTHNNDMTMDEESVSVWVSDEIFEDALIQIAKSAGLEQGRVDASIAVASLLRMWRMALPSSVSKIIPRTFARLLPELSSVSGVSALVDAIWLGLLKELEPSLSSSILEKLLPALSEEHDLRLSAALHVCSTLLLKYGRQSIKENGLSQQYGLVSSTLMKRAHEVLDVSSHFVRMGGVRTMSAIVTALPRYCSQLLTAVLQELRIADLTMATKHSEEAVSRTFAGLKSVEKELSSILGNSAALSVLIGKVSSGECNVPDALWRQCTIDSLVLLRPHLATQKPASRDTISDCIRRRAGWGLVAAQASSKRKELFHGSSLKELISLWKEELGFAGGRGAKNGLTATAPSHRAGAAGSTDPSSLDEIRAQSSVRSAALYALSCALRNASSTDLVRCGEVLLGACAARIIAKQNAYGLSMVSPSSAISGNSPGLGPELANISDPTQRRRTVLSISKFLMMESFHLVDCMNFISPRGDGSELCYYIAVCLGEEAQRVVGESESTGMSDLSATQGSSGSLDKAYLFDTAMSNHMQSLNRPSHLYEDNCTGLHEEHDCDVRTLGEERNSSSADLKLWPFSKQGFEALNAEGVLASCAVGIATLVCEDLKASGSIVESLSSGKLGPSMSALIALELSRRLSFSDLAEINRALAVLQVLAKRSLAVTGGMRRGALSESRTGKLYTPHTMGDGNNLKPQDVPGTAFERHTKAHSWWKWAQSFSDEGRVAKAPFHDFHTRALGIMHSTRLVAAEAHRELGNTGGATLWIGLMRRVLSVIKDNLNCDGTSQCALLANGFASLGALLEVVPNTKQTFSKKPPRHTDMAPDVSLDIDAICGEAERVFLNAIENGNVDAQSAAALALSHCSLRVAASSETLLNALLKGWACDRGQFTAMGQVCRSVSEADVWASCFSRIWRDMGVRVSDTSLRFFSADSSGIGSNSPCLTAGAAAVLSSCRLHCWALTESGYHAAMEMSTEILQWTGNSSRKARAAGLYAMTALWASRIDEARVHRISQTNYDLATRSSLARSHPHGKVPAVLPIESFSLKESSKISSAVGPFLDEVLYEALAPYAAVAHTDELQNAAIAAVTEMIRGAGVEETCNNLPRIPETLFAAVENRSIAARRLLHVMAAADAQSRPKYWFGLCRAVCMDGVRLNHGPSKAVWDVTHQTKVFSTKIAVEAVDSSLGACACLQREKEIDLSNSIVHTCAYDFLPKVADFASEVCKKDSFDFEECVEGCNLIQRIATRMASTAEAWSSDDQTMRDYRTIWDTCLSTLERLLQDNVPHVVLNSAGSALCELLISFLRLREMECFASAPRKVSSFLEKSLRQDFRRRFLYSDQEEVVGIKATLETVARFAKIVTTWCATSHVADIPTTEETTVIQSVNVLFRAVVGDFISILTESGLEMVAKSGGALTSALDAKEGLRKAYLLFIEPVVLGAIACMGASCGANFERDGHSWANPASAGTRLVEAGGQFCNVSASCYVWLVTRYEEGADLLQPSASFCAQHQEALFGFCNACRESNAIVKEIFVSFAQWNRCAYFQFASELSEFGNLDSALLTIVADVYLGALLQAMQGKGSAFLNGVDGNCTMSGAISGVTKMIHNLAESDIKSAQHLAQRALDCLFWMIGSESPEVVSMYNDVALQTAVCNCMSRCINHATDSSRAARSCVSRVVDMFQCAYREESLALLKVSMAMGTTLCEIVNERETEDKLVEILQTPIANEKEEDSLAELTLGWTLRCHGTQQFIADMMKRGLEKNSGGSGNARALAYQLGVLGLSTRHCCIPTCLRVAISAITLDAGRECSINRVGLLLFSIYLSKIVLSLPSKSVSTTSKASQSTEAASFLVEIAANDKASLRNVVSLLGDVERNTVKLFLLASEVESKDTNTQKQLTL